MFGLCIHVFPVGMMMVLCFLEVAVGCSAFRIYLFLVGMMVVIFLVGMIMVFCFLEVAVWRSRVPHPFIPGGDDDGVVLP